MKKLVSIIIPTYERPTNLIRCINSVIAQDYDQIEIIVVDDNGIGTDFQKETQLLLEEYIISKKIKYLAHTTNKNASAARNTGFRISKGEYINFVDDDDVLGRDKIRRQIEFLETNDQFDAVYCDTVIQSGSNILKRINPEKVYDLSDILLEKVFFNTSTVLFRRTVIEELGGFDESFRRHQDWELYIRYLRKHVFGKAYCQPLIKYSSENIITSNPRISVDLKEKFLLKFKMDISSHPKSNDIYHYQYNQLVELLLATRNYKSAYYCFKQSLKYSLPSLREFIRYSYFIIRPFIYGNNLVKK